MKKKDFTELKSRKIEDLLKIVLDKKSELKGLFRKKIGREKDRDIKKFRRVKKDMAQVLTLIKEKRYWERRQK